MGTLPTFGLMETESAPLTFHCRFEDWPAKMVVGVAEKLTIAGATVVVTVVVV